MADLKQQERQQRGEDFQDELRRSWHYIQNCWRMRIADRSGGTRPADDIILLNSINILAEAKRTAGAAFELSMIRTNQSKGLIDFDNVLRRNKGLVFISFLNDDTDEAYVFRYLDALRYMGAMHRKHIKLDELRKRRILCEHLPIRYDDEGNRYYDLKGVERCFR